MKFPVGVSSKVLGYGTLWAAWRRGYFEREGLDVDVVLMRGTAPAVQALIANSISAALLANDGPITAVEQGADLAMIASGSKITHMLMGAKNYKTYEDLRGATIGSSTLTSGTTFVLRRALKLKGLEYPRDYKLLSVGGTTEAFLAMNAGQTAASMMAVPYSFRAQELGFNLIGRMVDVFPELSRFRRFPSGAAGRRRIGRWSCVSSRPSFAQRNGSNRIEKWRLNTWRKNFS